MRKIKLDLLYFYDKEDYAKDLFEQWDTICYIEKATYLPLVFF